MDLKDILVSETTMNKENEFSSFNMNPTRAYSNNGTAASPQQDPIRGSQRHQLKVTIADSKPPAIKLPKKTRKGRSKSKSKSKSKSRSKSKHNSHKIQKQVQTPDQSLLI